MKYIVTTTGNFAIFDEGQKHCDVARSLSGVPVSAGFIKFIPMFTQEDNVGVTAKCYGSSFTLGLSSRIEDAGIINGALWRR